MAKKGGFLVECSSGGTGSGWLKQLIRAFLVVGKGVMILLTAFLCFLDRHVDSG